MLLSFLRFCMVLLLIYNIYNIDRQVRIRWLEDPFSCQNLSPFAFSLTVYSSKCITDQSLKNGNAPIRTSVRTGTGGPASHRTPCASPPCAVRHCTSHRVRPAPSRLVPRAPPVPCAVRASRLVLRAALHSPVPRQLASIGRQQIDEHMFQSYVSYVLDICCICFI